MDTTLYHPRVSDDGLKVLTNAIRLLIPKPRRKYDLELVVRAILHRIDNGAKWRSIGSAALPWHVAYGRSARPTTTGAGPVTTSSTWLTP